MSSALHTPGPWRAEIECDEVASIRADGCRVVLLDRHRDGSDGYRARTHADARLIAATPDYFDATHWILQAVANNAAPVDPIAALEELAPLGKHITLDAGLVLDLLKAHIKATGAAS